MDNLDGMNHVFRNTLVKMEFHMREIETLLGELRLAQNTYSQFLDQCFAELKETKWGKKRRNPFNPPYVKT